MTKYRIIGNMTGNSMDAIDLVLTEFDGCQMTDICCYTKPYTKNMQEKMAVLREKVFDKTKVEIESIPEFRVIHDEYISQIAMCIDEMCNQNRIDKATINAIGFHGKTLDHNPPSKAKILGILPYTLQIGSGQMLADLTGIPVVYDFRSDYIMAGFEGAPLVLPLTAHISQIEGDGCYYNGGNTSNFSIVVDGKALVGADAGPFNEYIDSFVRLHTGESFDKDGKYGKKGKLDKELLQEMFNLGRHYYEMPLPKSGDPAYYHKKEVFQYVEKQGISFYDAVRTFEYFAAYIAVQALTLVCERIEMNGRIILFGGGWKNPIVRESFRDILCGNGYVLAEHKETFSLLLKRVNGGFDVQYSQFGEYMEARLFADLARYKLENKVWELPEVLAERQNIVAGCVALPSDVKETYDDCFNRAAKGWFVK